MTFDEYISELGYELVQTNRDGSQRLALRSNSYLQWWLTLDPSGGAELTWEFELGSYLKAKGFAVSVQDELSLMVFPPADVRGPASPDWLATEMEKAHSLLDSVDFRKGV